MRNGQIQRGYYSVIQYCPCRRRSERVNVGLALCRPKNNIPFNEWVDPDCIAECAINTVFVDNLSRVNRLFSLSDDDAMFLMESIVSMKSRLEKICSLCEFKEYAVSRANDLRITEPRMMVIDRDILTMFAELVL